MNLKQLSGNKSRRVSDATSKGIKLPNTNLWFYGTKWDINGNTVAVFSFDKNGGRKWSVQVNAYDAFRGLHLPSNNTPVDIINANSKESIEKAVVKYINEFGTKMQKNGLFVEPNYVSDSRRVSDDYTYPSEWDDEFKYDENNGLYHYTMAAVELKGGYRSKYKTGGYADTIEECTEQAKIDAEEMYNKWKDFSDWIQGVSKVDVEIRDNEKNSILNYFYLTEDKDGSMYMSKGWVNDSRKVSDSVDFITLFERLERAFGGCDANRNVAKVYVNNQIINVELSVDQVAYIYSNNAKTANDVADIQRSDFADDDSFFDAVIDEIKTYRVYYGK